MSEVRRYFKEVRFRQLRALMEVAETGSFTDAAERLGLSIPSVWQQIRALEDEFELELVVQSGKGVRLTAEAEEMVRMVAPLVEGFDQIRERFGNRSGQREKRVVIATTPSLLSNELDGGCSVSAGFSGGSVEFFGASVAGGVSVVIGG